MTGQGSRLTEAAPSLEQCAGPALREAGIDTYPSILHKICGAPLLLDRACEFWKYPPARPPSAPKAAPHAASGAVKSRAVNTQHQEPDKHTGKLRFEYKVPNPISPLGQHGDTVFLGSQDFFLYAFDLIELNGAQRSGRADWVRFAKS